MGFLLTNPALLAALAGLGLPVLLHLILKRRQPRLRFSTLRFFQPHAEQASQRRKLRHWLLLALRLLVFALVVLAFARPFRQLSATAARARQRQQVVLVLDRSLSLTATLGRERRWESALRQAVASVEKLQTEDRVALITCADRAETVAGFSPPAVIAAKLKDLQPSVAPADLANGLREAARVIATGESGLDTSILVVSDLQRSGLENLRTVPLPAKVTVRPVPIGDLLTPNLAVTSLSLEAADDGLPHATIVSFADDAVAELPVEVRVDDQPVWNRKVNLPAGGSTNVEFRLPALASGWHTVEFRLNPSVPDALPADDRRFLPLLIPEPIRVVTVETRAARRSFEAEMFFVRSALDPTAGSTTNRNARFQVEAIAPSALAARLAPSPGQGGSGRTAAGVVVASLTAGEVPGTVAALEGFVRAGGGLLLFTPADVAPLRVNPIWSALSPAPLKSLETATGLSSWRVGAVEPATTYLEGFQRAGGGDLTQTEFRQRFQLDPLPAARISARFEDGVPLLLERSVGAGRVLLVNADADTSTTDWPKHKTYVPWLHRVAQHLAGRRVDETWSTGAEFVAGTRIDPGLDAVGTPTGTWKLSVPGQREAMALAPEAGHWPEIELTHAGVYTLHDPTGTTVRRWAANVSPSEADLAALRPAEFPELIARLPAANALSETAGLWGNERNRDEFSRVLLLSALALLVAETLWSNRIYA